MTENSNNANDIGLGLTGTSLDQISKTKSSLGIYTQNIGINYYPKGWGGSQYVYTFNLGKIFDKMSTGLSIYTTTKSYYDIAKGDRSVLTYSDAAVGTVGLGARLWSYYSGAEIPYVGEGVAIYGTARLGWDIGTIMGEGNAQYIEEAKSEGCNICLLDH